jgi:hypothetical protein
VILALGEDLAMWPQTAASAARYLERHAGELELPDLARLLSGLAAIPVQGSLEGLANASAAGALRLYDLLGAEGEASRRGATAQRRTLADLQLACGAFVMVGEADPLVVDAVAERSTAIVQALCEGGSDPAAASAGLHIALQCALLSYDAPRPSVATLVATVTSLISRRLASLSPSDAAAMVALRAHVLHVWHAPELVSSVLIHPPVLQLEKGCTRWATHLEASPGPGRAGTGEAASAVLQLPARSHAAVRQRLRYCVQKTAGAARLLRVEPWMTRDSVQMDAAAPDRNLGALITRRSDYLPAAPQPKGSPEPRGTPGLALRSTLAAAAATGWRMMLIRESDLMAANLGGGSSCPVTPAGKDGAALQQTGAGAEAAPVPTSPAPPAAQAAQAEPAARGEEATVPAAVGATATPTAPRRVQVAPVQQGAGPRPFTRLLGLIGLQAAARSGRDA